MIVEENSIIQINLTNHNFNNEGKMKFKMFNPSITMKPFINNDVIKNVPKGNYLIEWKYNENSPPNEILFWICVQGKINVNFLGMSEQPQINKEHFDFNSNEGMNIKKTEYKLSEKLGEFFKRKAKIYEFIENTLHCNLNADEEDKGYMLNYKEYDNVAFSFIMNREDSTKSRILSQNLDFPEFIFEGPNYKRSRIIGNGNIYLNNNIVFNGKINYNLFPQYVKENNSNRLIIDVESKRFKLSQEISEDELVNINVRRVGPFEGQINTGHPHALTKCRTYDRLGWICDHCRNNFRNSTSTFYCSVCDYDFCGENCRSRNLIQNIRVPNYYPSFHFKTSQHEHPLIYIKMLNRTHHLKCFCCLKDVEDKVYYCTKCDFRLCKNCKINETKGEIWQFHTCWHEHPLTLCKTKGKRRLSHFNESKVEILDDKEFFFTCNHCGIEYPRKKDSFYCTACDFYICMKCYKDYFFYIGRETENAVNVNMENKKVAPVECICFLEDNNNIKCKKCDSDLNINNWNYYCSNCNSIFCNQCYNYHKVVFENNILIFDGFFENDMKNGFGITYKKNNELKYSGNWVNNQFKLLRDISHSHNFTRNDFNERINCDYCHKKCDSNDSGLSCRRCDLDICDKCITEINKKVLENNSLINRDCKIEKFSNFKRCCRCNLRKKSVFFKVGIFFFIDYYCCECFKNM